MTVAASTQAPSAGEDRRARFWDRMARRYARKPVAHPEIYQEKLKRIRAYLTPETELLEFGCGSGSTALALAPNVKSALATDLSEEMLAIAREKASKAGVENVRFAQASVERFEGAARTDAVLAMSLLHLVDDWKGAIAACHRLLRPGGVFVSSTMCLGDGMGWLRYVAPIARGLGLFPPLSFFREAELVEAIRAAGFEIKDVWRPGKRMASFVIAVKPG